MAGICHSFLKIANIFELYFFGKNELTIREESCILLFVFSTENIICNMLEWLSWWSTTLPRSGSRVRVPSRALLNIERGYPLGYPLSILNESCRTRTGSYLRFASVGAKPTSTGRCAPRLAPAFFLPDSNILGLHSVPVGALLPMHRM